MQPAAQTTKPRKLWGSPKVFINATHLIVEEKYYPLDQTRGAFVELAPPTPKAEKAATPKPPASFWSTLRTVLGVIVGVFVLFFAILYELTSFTSSSGSTQNAKFQLVMLSDSGKVVALEHTNQKKLKEIASAVNQALVAQGKTPDTGSYNETNKAK